MDKKRLLLFVSILTLPWTGYAEVFGSIRGNVFSYQEKPLEGADVIVFNKETKVGDFVLSDADGKFFVPNLPVGGYVLWIERYDHDFQVLETAVTPGQSDLITVTLEPYVSRNVAPRSPRPENYATVTVYYGTDREKVEPTEKKLKILRLKGSRTRKEDESPGYGPRRGNLAFGTVDVSIPRDHRMGHLESPSIWRFEFRPDPEKHIAVLNVTPKEQDRFFAEMRGNLAQSGASSALVFIHGYKVTFNDAARRTAQIAYDLGFDGIPMMYSWPSNGELEDYVGDGDNNEWSIPNAEKFLRLLAEERSIDKVHLIAHSMGNRLLTSALREIADSLDEEGAPQFEQIALVAPDIDAEIFERDIVPNIVGTGQRLTLYTSSNDKALLAAKAIRAGYSRAGDSSDKIVVVNGMDTIDVSALDTSFGGHSYYADSQSVIADLFYLIGKGLAPESRFRLRPETANGMQYWVFAP